MLVLGQDVEWNLLCRTNITGRETGGVYWVTDDGVEGFTWGGDGYEEDGVGKTSAPKIARGSIPPNAIIEIAIHTHPPNLPNRPQTHSDHAFPSQRLGDMREFVQDHWNGYIVVSNHGGQFDETGEMKPGAILLVPTRPLQDIEGRYFSNILDRSTMYLMFSKDDQSTLNSLRRNGDVVGYRPYLASFGGNFERWPM